MHNEAERLHLSQKLESRLDLSSGGRESISKVGNDKLSSKHRRKRRSEPKANEKTCAASLGKKKPFQDVGMNRLSSLTGRTNGNQRVKQDNAEQIAEAMSRRQTIRISDLSTEMVGSWPTKVTTGAEN